MVILYVPISAKMIIINYTLICVLNDVIKGVELLVINDPSLNKLKK